MMKKPTPKEIQSPRIRSLIAFSAFIMLSFIGIVGFQASQTYQKSLNEGKQSAIRLTHIVADHVELTFLGVDLSLRRAIERQYFNSLFGNNLPEYTAHNFKIWLAETPQIAAIALLNAHQEVEVEAHKENYDNWLGFNQTPAGKKLFEQMQGEDDSYIFMGRHTNTKGESLILMSRRYNTLGGEFGGIVIAAINPSYFTEFYNSVASGTHKFLALLLSDGSVLASGPSQNEDNITISREWLKQHASGKPQETYEYHDENVDKLGTLQTLNNLPITVVTMFDETDFMKDWHESRMKDIGFIVLFTIFGSILSFFALAMAKQIIMVQESEGAAILASQAKSEFLANMSHELRTPLNAIIGFSEMINSGYFGPLNPKQKERIHDIHLCGSHLLQLITDILEFSKGDAGKLELVEEKVNLADLIDESVRIMNGKIKTKNIHLVVAIDPHLATLWGDKRKIRQILINLLSNAHKFTPENGTISVSAKMDAQNNITLAVADTGIGIAEDDIPRALSVFGQVNRTKSHEGTGLGLPLCKMYATLHDGELILTSKLGEGTTVKIIFPHQRSLINGKA